MKFNFEGCVNSKGEPTLIKQDCSAQLQVGILFHSVGVGWLICSYVITCDINVQSISSCSELSFLASMGSP
jgi:hypothetical protein